MDKIKKVSKWYRISLQAIFWYIPLSTIVFWVFLNDYDGLKLTRLPDLQYVWTPGHKIIGGFIDMTLLASLKMVGIGCLIKLFKQFEQGDVFSSENFHTIRCIGYCVVLYPIATIIFDSLMVLLLTFDNPPGQRYISVGFSDVNVFWLIGGGMIILVAWIMREASRLHNDLQYTV